MAWATLAGLVALVSSSGVEPDAVSATAPAPAPRPEVQRPDAIAPTTPDAADPTPTTPAAAPTPTPASTSTTAAPAPTPASTSTTAAPAPTTTTTTARPPTAAPPSPAETNPPSSPATPAEPSKNSDESPRRVHPRLVLALGPMIGPHAIGNEQCIAEEARCEKKGSFFGAGGNLEVRARLYRPLYLQVRGFAIRNVSPNDPIYSGLVGAGVGLGAYARRIFARAEYLAVRPLGDNRFEPPFFEGEVARDEWGNHAGMVSVGFRQPLPKGLAIELWGGPMFGPRSVRLIPQAEPDERLLTTFMLGLNLSWDAWK